MQLAALILAGGRSRRMGKPKESLPFLGTTLLGRTVDTLLDCAWPVVVVGRGGDQELPPFSIEAEVVHDERPGAGPLWALATGMRQLLGKGLVGEQDATLVTGCDHPFLLADAVGWLAERLGDHQLVIPRAAGVLQPLCAVYRLDILPAVTALLAEGIDTPRTLAERVRTRVLEEEELRRFDSGLRFLRSVDTPEAYEQARAEAGG